MRFTKIKVGKEAVELAWTFTDANGATLSTQLTHADKPAPELIEALQAFKPWAMDLIEAPESWLDESRVSTLSLNEEKTGKTRGLMVSMVRPIPRASGRPLSLTTPHVREEGENTAAGATGVYGDDVVAMIASAEKAAEAYVKGDRAQAEIFPTDSSNPVEGAAKAAATPGTDDVSKRRERKARPPKELGTPNEVMNPGQTTPLTDPELRKLLLSVDRDVPEDALALWTSSERDKAQYWAEKKLASMAGTPVPLEALVEPDAVLKYATPSLGADGWKDSKPPKLDEGAVAEIQASIEKA